MRKVSFTNLILLLLNVSFILVDWRLSFMTFADLFLIFIFGLLIFYNFKRSRFLLTKKQILLMLFILILITFNVILNMFFNLSFSHSEGIQGLAKVSFYLTTVILIFNYLNEFKLGVKLLKSLSIAAVIVTVIGIYIMVSIYLNGRLPYEFFWEFTRQDLHSYTYRGWGRSIIRMRSVFSEPAYLGFYLNAVLAILYFNRHNYQIKKSHELIIILGIILTFSYSSILVFIGILFMRYLNWKDLFHFIKSKRNLLAILFTIIAIFLLWDTIEKTIIIRTQEIISGADGSGTSRLQGSWSYINYDNIVLGNGIGNTPAIWNVYAYILSDLGLVNFTLYLTLSFWLLCKNPKLGLVFIALGFQKGGYLGAGYWIFLLFILFFTTVYIRQSTLKRGESEKVQHYNNSICSLQEI